MYVPHAFQDDDIEELAAFMRENAFATVVSSGGAGGGGVPVATHMPVTVTRAGGTMVLRGHFAKANPHWRCVEAGETLVVFAGPHAYVSPRHYEKRESVPTWNYRAVHAYGHARITERDGTLIGLHDLIAEHEAGYRQQWEGLPERYREGMLGGIVGFEITVERLEGAAKLSQNKRRCEQERIADALVDGDDQEARAVGCEMQRRMASEVDEDETDPGG